MDEEEYAYASRCLQDMTLGRVLEFRGMPKEVARLPPWRQLEQWRERWRVHAEPQQCARQYEHEHWLSLRPVRFLALLGQNPLAVYAPTDQDLSIEGRASPKKHTGMLLSPSGDKYRACTSAVCRSLGVHGGVSGPLIKIV